jgi:hypothetical protein
MQKTCKGEYDYAEVDPSKSILASLGPRISSVRFDQTGWTGAI